MAPASPYVGSRHRGCERGVLVAFTMAIFEFPSVPFGDLDLLRAGGLDPRSVALLDPSAHPDAAVLKFFRLDAGGGEACARYASRW